MFDNDWISFLRLHHICSAVTKTYRTQRRWWTEETRLQCCRYRTTEADKVDIFNFRCCLWRISSSLWNRLISSSCRHKNSQTHTVFFLTPISLFQCSCAVLALCLFSNVSTTQTSSLSLSGPTFCHCLILLLESTFLFPLCAQAACTRAVMWRLCTLI